MSAPRSSPLEGQPSTNRPPAAELALPRADLGDSKGVAEGVPTAVRSDQQQGDGRYPVAWLRISAPRGTTPSASSTCLCGWDRHAFGQRRILALIEAHTAHRDECPLRTPREGRTAA